MKGGWILGALLLVLGLVAGGLGGYGLARRLGARHAAELRAVIDSQGVALTAASVGLQAASASATSWIDSVRVLTARIRSRPKPGITAGSVPSPPNGSPVGEQDTAAVPEPTGPDLGTGLVEACSSLATSCAAMRDSAAKLDTLAHVQHDSIATLLALPQPVAPPPITISVGRFKTGAAVGAGGATLLLVSLYLLLHH